MSKAVEQVSQQDNLMYEEDIEAAVDRLVSLLGPQGNIRYSSNKFDVLTNMRVYSPKCGFLWYGDILITDLGKLKKFAAEFGQPIFVANEHQAKHLYAPTSELQVLASADAVFSATGETVKLRYTESMIGA
jgi:hypothetical protein